MLLQFPALNEAGVNRMTTKFNPDDLLTTAEAGKIIGISKRRVQELCQAGRIEHQRIGKSYIITRAAAEAFAKLERPAHRPAKQ